MTLDLSKSADDPGDSDLGGFSCFREQEVWEAHCAGKDRYPSLSAAEAHLKMLYRGRLLVGRSLWFPRQEWSKLHPYECIFVPEGEEPHWHVGHLR